MGVSAAVRENGIGDRLFYCYTQTENIQHFK